MGLTYFSSYQILYDNACILQFSISFPPFGVIAVGWKMQISKDVELQQSEWNIPLKNTICFLYGYSLRALPVWLAPSLPALMLHLAGGGISQREGLMNLILLRVYIPWKGSFVFCIMAVYFCSGVCSKVAAASKKKSLFLVLDLQRVLGNCLVSANPSCLKAALAASKNPVVNITITNDGGGSLMRSCHLMRSDKMYDISDIRKGIRIRDILLVSLCRFVQQKYLRLATTFKRRIMTRITRVSHVYSGHLARALVSEKGALAPRHSQSEHSNTISRQRDSPTINKGRSPRPCPS